jgi:hypothetical protein
LVLLANWQKPDPKELEERDVPLISEIRQRVADHARRSGLMPTNVDASVLRAALTHISKGKMPPPPTPSAAFLEATGGNPVAEKKRKGGPLSNDAIGDVTFALACIYHELTGSAPGYSSTVETPEGSFRAFAYDWGLAVQGRDGRIEPGSDEFSL